jgi:hypothetical protein
MITAEDRACLVSSFPADPALAQLQDLPAGDRALLTRPLNPGQGPNGPPAGDLGRHPGPAGRDCRDCRRYPQARQVTTVPVAKVL